MLTTATHTVQDAVRAAYPDAPVDSVSSEVLQALYPELFTYGPGTAQFRLAATSILTYLVPFTPEKIPAFKKLRNLRDVYARGFDQSDHWETFCAEQTRLRWKTQSAMWKEFPMRELSFMNPIELDGKPTSVRATLRSQAFPWLMACFNELARPAAAASDDMIELIQEMLDEFRKWETTYCTGAFSD